jgi:hypothetical protein
MASGEGFDALLVCGGLVALCLAVGLLSFEKLIVLAVADGYYAIARRSPRWLLPQPWVSAEGPCGLLTLVRLIGWAGRGGCLVLGGAGVAMLLVGLDAFG